MTYLRREFFIIRCFLGLLKRDFGKYFTVAGMTWFLGAAGIYRSAKPAYFFCRYLDDLADGDRSLPAGQSFEALIERFISLVDEPGNGAKTNLELVLVDAIKKLNESAHDPKVVASELKDFLKSMLVDYQRRMAEKAIPSEELHELYDQSFASVLQLALIGFRTRLEREHISKLGIVQGKIYALQDLEEELSRGIIYVPEEVFTEAGLTAKEVVVNPKKFTGTEVFRKWRVDELILCQQYTEELLTLNTHKRAMKMTRILVLPLDKYIKSELSRLAIPDL